MKSGIYYNGKDYEEFKNAFLVFFDDECLQDVLEKIDDNKEELLDEEECFIIESEQDNKQYQAYNKFIPEIHYHINIKNTTIVCLQIFFELLAQKIISGDDIKEQEVPIIPTVIELKKCFNKIQEENGEICILKEILRNKNGISGWNDFSGNVGECVNNDLNCSYNCEGCCVLTKDVFEKIIDTMIKRKMLCVKNNRYRITF